MYYKSPLRLTSFITLFLGVIFTFTNTNLFAQQVVKFPTPDADGFITLFRGDNFSDFYSQHRSNTSAFPSKAFITKGDSVEVMNNSQGGHFVFKQTLSRYHIRYRLKHFDIGNGGMFLHLRENEPKIMEEFPRSLECQGYNSPTNMLGDLWTISKVFVNVKVKNAAGHDRQYDPNGIESTHGDPNGRHIRSLATTNGIGKWDTVEAKVYGADSIIHIVNGKVVMKYSRIRVSEKDDPNDYKTPLGSGNVGWQSEGGHIIYNNMQVKILPGDPLYQAVVIEPTRARTLIAKRNHSNLMQLFPSARPWVSSNTQQRHTLLGQKLKPITVWASQVQNQ